jgi:hypothetical protein
VTLSERTKLATTLAVGVVVPGVADYALSAAGYERLGLAVWAVGYLTMALVVWWVWLRPLDLTGPSG